VSILRDILLEVKMPKNPNYPAGGKSKRPRPPKPKPTGSKKPEEYWRKKKHKGELWRKAHPNAHKISRKTYGK